MKNLTLIALTLAAAASQATFSYIGGTMTDNFDGLSVSNVTGLFTGVGVATAIPGSTFDGARVSGTGSSMNYTVSNGGANSGAIYGFADSGTTEFALGAIASGSNIAGFGVQIVNNSGAALQNMTIRFTQENWRSSTSTQNIFAAAWGRSSTGASSSNYLVDTNLTAVTALDLVGPTPVASNGALLGNDPSNQIVRTTTFTFSTPVAIGETVFIRWQDFNDVGNDAGLAIDNFSVTAQPVPEPATLAAVGLGIAAMLRRRKSN